MRFQAPFGNPGGPNDTTAVYINGNPTTGTAGSVPPAASIEYPQREIINLITDAGITPADTDLHQAAKAVQSGQLIFGVDIGTVNAVSIAASPPVLALRKGMQFVTIFANNNTGPATASISGLPFVAIVHPTDLTPLQPLDLRQGAVGCLMYDGTYFQLAWAQRPIGAPVFLTASLNYYVGGAGASDLNDGTTATVSGIHGPFATLQKAMNTIANFNLNGHNINITVADGTYQSVRLSAMSGSGAVFWTGDSANPQNCVINGSGVSGIIGLGCGGAHVFRGFAVQTSGAYTNDPMSGVWISGTGTGMQLYDMQYNQCSGCHIDVGQGCLVGTSGKEIIAGSALGANASRPQGWHINCISGAIIQNAAGAAPNLTITGAFAGGNGGGFITANTLSYAGVGYSSISGASNWSGYKYVANGLSIIASGGGGVNYYPGSVAGTVSNGGQYY